MTREPAHLPSAWAWSIVLVGVTILGACSPLAAVPRSGPAHPARWISASGRTNHPPISSQAMVPVEWRAVAGRSTSGTAQGRLVLSVGTARLVLPFPTVARARQEGDRLAARLALVASTRTSLREVAAGTCDGGSALAWRGRIVLPLTNAQARDLGQTPRTVVASWVAALRKAGADPRRPSALPRELQVPCGETRTLALPVAWLGSAPGRVEDPDVASVKATILPAGSRTGQASTTSSHDLHVTGSRVGVTRVTLERRNQRATLELRVLEHAGTLPRRLDLYVAGGSADPGLMLDAAERSLDHQARGRPGAALTTCWTGSPARLMEAPVPLTAWLEGPGLAPAVQRLQVCGHPSALRFAPPSALAASNHPEQIVESGRLLDVPLGAGTSTWYFHHQNVPGAPPRTVQTRLENRSDRPTLLLITACAAGPSRDELYVGHLATWRYLRRMVPGQGWQARLLPGDHYVLDERILGPREVGCGLGLVMVAEGAPPSLVVEATDEGPPMDATLGHAGTKPAETRPGAATIRGRGLFAHPLVDLEATYTVDGPYAFIPVGAPPFGQPLGEGTPNHGNYGVEHRVRIHLVNPTAGERRIWVVLGAAAGAARGSLEVDGRLMETPVLSTAPGGTRECGIGDYLLAPGATRDVRVRIIPEPGSNYPVRIIVKPLGPNQ